MNTMPKAIDIRKKATMERSKAGERRREREGKACEFNDHLMMMTADDKYISLNETKNYSLFYVNTNSLDYTRKSAPCFHGEKRAFCATIIIRASLFCHVLY